MQGCSATLEGLSFEQGVARAIAALRAEGFEGLSDASGPRPPRASMRRHLVLEVPCVPDEPGALSDLRFAPCSVMVREEAPGRVLVSFMAPAVRHPATEEAGNRVRRACARLGQTAG